MLELRGQRDEPTTERFHDRPESSLLQAPSFRGLVRIERRLLPAVRLAPADLPDLRRPRHHAAAIEPQDPEAVELVRRVLDESEDVGDRFPDEARRIHYRETRARSIRGVATREETTELLDEGIVVLPLPIPPSRDLH